MHPTSQHIVCSWRIDGAISARFAEKNNFNIHTFHNSAKHGLGECGDCLVGTHVSRMVLSSSGQRQNSENLSIGLGKDLFTSNSCRSEFLCPLQIEIVESSHSCNLFSASLPSPPTLAFADLSPCSPCRMGMGTFTQNGMGAANRAPEFVGIKTALAPIIEARVPDRLDK
ncbi:unnamed protein product [Haemonchus placei]|uniref:Uncharacterized protein n=1 Tax=Haemonchus placei TaxID=6290 RepID=A0A3P8B501_HAEPC|nr:unnamed protein product [Haemonchus placei]